MIRKLFGTWKAWQFFAVITVLLVAAVSMALAGPAAGIESAVK